MIDIPRPEDVSSMIKLQQVVRVLIDTPAGAWSVKRGSQGKVSVFNDSSLPGAVIIGYPDTAVTGRAYAILGRGDFRDMFIYTEAANYWLEGNAE